MDSLATIVAHERTRQGLSLRALGKASGVAFSTLARVERGEGAYDQESERKLRLWLGEDVSTIVSAEEQEKAEELGRIMARACADEIMNIVRAALQKE